MTDFSLFDMAAIVVFLAAAFGYVNHRWMKLPPPIGLVIIALLASLGVIGLDALIPGLGFRDAVRGALGRIDFAEALMKGMLCFLLFAGALHVDLGDLRRRKWAIGCMATVGVLMSTFLVGFALFYAAGLLGLDIPLAYCLVFGALISPTDPIAVLGILKTVRVPPSLEAKFAGESLFNDGVGIVVFTILVAIAAGGGGGGITALDAARLFVMEAVGGTLLGLAAGWIAYRAMRSIDEHNLEVLITLALVMLAYAVSFPLHVSGPIAMVVAGLLIGNHGARFAMSETTRDHVRMFWSLIDEILNAVLFLIIGFEVVALSFSGEIALIVVIAVPVVLAARLVSVATPLLALAVVRREFTRGAIPVLTWGGLRGGISVALALSLPEVPGKDMILAATYGVVIFSIIVQGLTMKRLVQALVTGETP